MKKLLGLTLVAALLTFACGSGGGEGGTQTQTQEEAVLPGEVVAAAATQATAQESAKIAMEMMMTTPMGEVTMIGDGAMDIAQNRGNLSFKASGTGQMGPSFERMGNIEIIYDGTTMYMQIPGLQQMMPAGKKWLKMDLEAMGKEAGFGAGQFSSFSQNNPTQQLDYLKAAGDIEEVGTEEVRGVETTHYKGVLEFDKLKDLLPEEVRSSIDKLKEQSGIERAPIEAWVDEDGLPRRIKYEMSYNPPDAQGAPGGLDMVMTIEFYDYGTEVEVEIPPASEVIEPPKGMAG